MVKGRLSSGDRVLVDRMSYRLTSPGKGNTWNMPLMKADDMVEGTIVPATSVGARPRGAKAATPAMEFRPHNKYLRGFKQA